MLLGYSISLDTMDELISKLMTTSTPLHVVSGNPEVLYHGVKNQELHQEFIAEDTLIIPDGIGVCYPLRWKGYQVQRLAGIDLVIQMLSALEKEEKTIYLLGGSSEVNKKMVDYLKKNYTELQIAGAHDGFFKDEVAIVNEIQASGADVLLVAMGAPKQELFIAKHRSQLSCQLMMGVGGTFDVLTGMVQRAPQWVIRLNMEWLYRVAKEPVRLKRLKNNFVFVGWCLRDQMKQRLKK